MKKQQTFSRFILPLLAALGLSNQTLAASVSDIVGGWGPVDSNGAAALIFMNDGTYVHIQDIFGGTGGQPGMERGTYSWNPITGALTSSRSVDTNGDWGLSNPWGPIAIQINGNSMTISEGGIVTGTGSRIADVANSIVGNWYANDPYTGQAGGLVNLTFMSDGTYIMSQDGNSILDPSGRDGIERGTYSWNPVTGAFSSACPIVDTNGEWGLSHGNVGGMGGCTGTMANVIVDGNTLKLNGGAFATRVASVPVPAAAWLLGSGLIGLIGVARRKAA